MWISLVPLFLAIQDKSAKHGFLLVFLSMSIFFLVTLHWLSLFGWAAWIASAFFQAAFPAMWGLVVSPFLRSRRASFLNIIFPPLSFTAMEGLRNLGAWGMPWGDLAYSQGHFLPIIQMASITGTLGLTFVLVLVNLLFFYALIQKEWRFCLAGLLVLSLPILWGEKRLGQTFSKTVKIALVQTNDLQTLKWDAAHYRRMLQELDRLVGQAQGGNPELVILPETALAGSLNRDPALQALVRSWAARLNAHLAVGTLLEKGNSPQNGIVLVNPSGEWTQSYAKIKLVPFGEYLPWIFRPLRGKWHALDPIVDFAPGDEPTIFSFRGKKFGVMICFESSFGWMARALVLRGAEFLAVPTNDAWFFETPAQEMHAMMGVFRSVETGRSCVQAGNTGISMISDPLGRVLAWQEANESKVVLGTAPLVSGLTWYDRCGDAFSYACMGLTLGILVWRRMFP